jgi:glucose/arabinose dehydrogenase
MRRTTGAAAMLALSFIVTIVAPPSSAGLLAIDAVPVATGLASPIGFAFLPDGQLVYVERQTGWVRFRDLATDVDRQIYRITNVNSEGERGAMGLAIHPAWPSKPFVFVFVTRTTPAGLRNQIFRIRVEGGEAVGARPVYSVVTGPNVNHIGGRIAFGPDGKLYIVLGDHADPANSQDLTSNVRGKILRINPDGTIPATNPFGDAVWAYGIRNSIGFDFDPVTGRLWEQDNGPECNDELNRIVRGGNHGWGPSQSCPNTNNSGPTPRIQPKYTFVDTLGLTGVAFCDGCSLDPAFEGDLFVGAVNDGTIHRFDLNASRTGFASGPVLVADQPGPVLSMESGPDGSLYFSDFGAIYRLEQAA